MGALKPVAVIVVLTIALVAYQFMDYDRAGPDIELTPQEPTKAELPTMAPEQVASAGLAESETPDESGCLTLVQIRNLPTVAQDAARLIALQTHGLPVAPYESFDDSTLHAFADQGDSAAMAVVGAAAVMRAYDIDAGFATRWLNNEYAIADLDEGQTQLSPDAGLHLNDAAYWFYQAALHGRLFALQHYGTVRSRLFGGPVGMGWLGQDEYDQLDDQGKSSLSPLMVYAQVAYDIAPQLREGLLADLSGDMPESDLQLAIRETLLADFEGALLDSGLQRVELAPTASPGIAALRDQICSAELNEFLNRQE